MYYLWQTKQQKGAIKQKNSNEKFSHRMNLIENYLKETADYDQNRSLEEKLEKFFGLFIQLEKKYATTIEDLKRLETEHKADLTEVLFTLSFFHITFYRSFSLISS